MVAEDEYMIAQEIAEILSSTGAETLGPVPSVSGAMHLIAPDNQIDCALLDVNLSNEVIWPVVEVLPARGVPLMLTTGYDVSAILPAYALLPRCEKPTSGRNLARALSQMLAHASSD